MPPWRIDVLGNPPPEPTTSGLDRSLWELGAGLVGRGHRVRILYATATPTVPPPYRGVEGVPIPIVTSRRRQVQQAVEVGRAAGDCVAPDTQLLLGTDERAGAIKRSPRGRSPSLAMYLHSVPSDRVPTTGSDGASRGLVDRLGSWIDQRTLRRLELDALGRASVVLTGSSATRDRLTQHHKIPSAKVTVLPPTVPEPDLVETRAQARMALRIPMDVPAAVFVGRRPERQGLAIALEAFHRSRVFFPGARFVVVGSSPKQDPGVIPLGVCDDATKARAFRAADLFLFPSLEAGPTCTVAEAMRYGLPALVSERVVIEGADAKREFRSVATDDPGDYAAEFAELFADPVLRRKIGDAGRQYADRFSGAKNAEAFEQALAGHVPG
ncbi:MAG: glycosyltransferase family 4 protein [Thermoplasmata archaeon]|nr:glycosyltransferase family 4 protein [Thermoplasmata archaeon]